MDLTPRSRVEDHLFECRDHSFDNLDRLDKIVQIVIYVHVYPPRNSYRCFIGPSTWNRLINVWSVPPPKFKNLSLRDFFWIFGIFHNYRWNERLKNVKNWYRWFLNHRNALAWEYRCFHEETLSNMRFAWYVPRFWALLIFTFVIGNRCSHKKTDVCVTLNTRII